VTHKSSVAARHVFVFVESTASQIASAVFDDQQTREIGGRATCLRHAADSRDWRPTDQQFDTRALDRSELTRRSICYRLKNFRHHHGRRYGRTLARVSTASTTGGRPPHARLRARLHRPVQLHQNQFFAATGGLCRCQNSTRSVLLLHAGASFKKNRSKVSWFNLDLDTPWS
jgi:hypothetical protein